MELETLALPAEIETYLVWGIGEDGSPGLFAHPDQVAAKIAYENHLKRMFGGPQKKMGRTTYFFDKTGVCTGHD